MRARYIGAWVTAAALLGLAPCAQAEEPFVDRPSRLARGIIYGLPVAGDAASTLLARHRGATELHPGLQQPAVMLAYKGLQVALLVWADGHAHPFWRWVLRIGAWGLYGWQTWRNLRVASAARL